MLVTHSGFYESPHKKHSEFEVHNVFFNLSFLYFIFYYYFGMIEPNYRSI